MPHMYWALAPSLYQALFIGIVFCVWTLVGTLVMKFWATFRVQIVVFALILLGSIFGISVRPLLGFFNVLALCAVGWFVTQHLSRNYGVPTKFPAVGAKVMTTMVIISSLLVVAIIVITKA